jgi:hypothetical protein
MPNAMVRTSKHIEKIYNVEVPPDLISRVTDAVTGEVKEWQDRHLEKSYAIVYLDAILVTHMDRLAGFLEAVRAIYPVPCPSVTSRSPLTIEEGIKHEISIHCDELISIPKTLLTNNDLSLNRGPL